MYLVRRYEQLHADRGADDLKSARREPIDDIESIEVRGEGECR